MTPEELRKRTKTFAIDVIRFCRRLPRTDEARVISWQLLRAGTGIGANYRAVCRFRSDKDFISKLGIVVEESDETVFWLKFLKDAAISDTSDGTELLGEARELLAIFIQSARTARENLRKS